MSYCLDHMSPGHREEIARSLFAVDDRLSRGHELTGLCPAHDETNPSFGYNVEKDACKCFGCGFSGDLITLWAHTQGIADAKEAFKSFRDTFDLNDSAVSGSPSPGRKGVAAGSHRGKGGHGEPVDSPEDTATQIIPEADFEALAPLPEDWRARCRDKFGWSDAVIDRIGLRLWQSPRGEKRIAIPVRDIDGRLVNIRLYLPGAKESKIVSWGKGFGKSKLFPAPDAWGPDPIILCEGEKDTLCALSRGLNACTQTAGCNSWDPKFNRFFEGRDVVIAYDADKMGHTGAMKVADNLSKVAQRVRVIIWPEGMHK